MNEEQQVVIQTYWDKDGHLITETLGNPNWKILGSLNAEW